MSIFMSSKSAAEKISGLEARIEELEGEVASLEALKAEAVTSSETIASLTAERDEAAGKIVAFEATIADQETTITEANHKLSTFDAEVAAKAQHEIANLGFKGEIPETKGEGGNEGGETLVSREAFNAMSPLQKSEFCKAGGKIKG